MLDVIRVAVGAKDVRRREPLALERLEQRLERRAAVDEHRDAARLVADEKRVREPPLVHRPLDDHHLAGYASEAGRQDSRRASRASAAILAALALRGARERRGRGRRRRSRSSATPAPAPIGLAVPGAGPTVTRESALNTLLTGEVQSSLLGGTPPSEPLLELGEGPPPDTLVVLPPPGRSENDRYPIAVDAGAARAAHVRLDADRRARLPRRRRARRARGRRVGRPRRRRSSGSQERIERNDRIRLPLSVLVGAIAYLAALFAPRLAPRVILLALAANLWLVGWWAVALVGLAAALLPLGVACAAILATYLLALGLDPEAVALSPFGPSQAGRFYGVSNLLETFLLLPALLGAALLGRLGIAVARARARRRRGQPVRCRRRRPARPARRVRDARPSHCSARVSTRGASSLGGVAVVVAGVALVGLDAALGGSSHVTDAVGDGPGAVLADVGDRLELSARRTFSSFGPAFAVLASLPVLAWVATRRPRRPITDALLVALAVSLARQRHAGRRRRGGRRDRVHRAALRGLQPAQGAGHPG